MSNATTPLVAVTRGGWGDRLHLRWSVDSAVRASFLVSPRPAARLVRREFAAGGAQTAQALARHAPPDANVVVHTNER